MSARWFSRRHPFWPATGIWLALAALGLAVGGCAGGAGTPRPPAELPLSTVDQHFQLRWRLERDPSAVRAVGLAQSQADREGNLTLALYGLDAAGRIVSRGVGYVQWQFARDPAPFVVTLTPTGREARFELHVLNYWLPDFHR
ncbi:MAG TPA: hypothetical protein VFC42_12620 [Methylomirabilota bacterium]|jgi:hypothetical protein|nr:hypothetical protein [Methylomirabilota bacterium]